MADPTLAEWLAFAAVILAAFLLSLALNAALRPWFVRYALARPKEPLGVEDLAREPARPLKLEESW